MAQFPRYYKAKENDIYPPYRETPWLFNLKTHNVIVGRTGTGKTNYLLHIIEHLNGENCNIVLLDPHGQASDAALKLSSKNKMLLSGHDYPGSEGVYSGINVLRTTGGQENAYLVADWVRQAFSEDESLSQGTWGPRLNLNFSQILASLMLREKGLTLKKFAEILSESKRTLSYFPVQEHSPVRAMIQAFSSIERNWSDFVMSSENKILPLVSNPLVRRVISAQDKNSVDLDTRLREADNNLIIPELNMGYIGKPSVMAIASLLLARIWSVLLQKGPSEDKTHIIIDEAHLIPEPILEILIAQGRKYGVVLTLTYQSFSQVSERFRETIFSNFNDYACFEVSKTDADYIVSNVDGGKNDNNLDRILVNQDFHHVTVFSKHLRIKSDLGGMVDRYGPVTGPLRLIKEIPSEAEVNEIKASIINKIGYREDDEDSKESPATPHNLLIFRFSDFLNHRNISNTIEPDIGGLIPDLLISHNGEDTYCEVEVSDLEVTNRIAKKMKDYMGRKLIFLCRNEEFGKLVSVISSICEKAETGGVYSNEEGNIESRELPLQLLNVSLLTFEDDQFYFFNGVELVRFNTTHLEKDSSIRYRARKLPLGSFREEVLEEVTRTISDNGRIDLDIMEEKFGREKLRTLLQNIHERGYESGLTVNSLLELDRIDEQEDLRPL